LKKVVLFAKRHRNQRKIEHWCTTFWCSKPEILNGSEKRIYSKTCYQAHKTRTARRTVAGQSRSNRAVSPYVI